MAYHGMTDKSSVSPLFRASLAGSGAVRWGRRSLRRLHARCACPFAAPRTRRAKPVGGYREDASITPRRWKHRSPAMRRRRCDSLARASEVHGVIHHRPGYHGDAAKHAHCERSAAGQLAAVGRVRDTTGGAPHGLPRCERCEDFLGALRPDHAAPRGLSGPDLLTDNNAHSNSVVLLTGGSGALRASSPRPQVKPALGGQAHPSARLEADRPRATTEGRARPAQAATPGAFFAPRWARADHRRAAALFNPPAPYRGCGGRAGREGLPGCEGQTSCGLGADGGRRPTAAARPWNLAVPSFPCGAPCLTMTATNV